MNNYVYADNAATTKLDPEALKAMMPYLTTEFGNPSQPYSFAHSAKKALKDARETIAKCINAEPEEIVFISGGTEGDNWVIKETMMDSEPGSTLISSEIEHHALLHSGVSLERFGYHFVCVPVDSSGSVSPEKLERMITDNTKLVSVMYSNNEVGTIQPIKELAAVAHKHGALFHTDAVQAVGHVKIDVKELGVDFLSTSAHKFNGPKGIGFLYIKNGIELNSSSDGGAQENGRRAGTEDVASVVGMAVALKRNCDNLESNTKHLVQLEQELIKGLKETSIDFIRNGAENHVPGNLSLSFKNSDGEMLLHRLDLMGICVSTGSACDSKNTELSHVLKAMRIPEEYAYGTIRISLGKDNTIQEVKTIVHALSKILNQ